jgi:hypothetical protein
MGVKVADGIGWVMTGAGVKEAVAANMYITLTFGDGRLKFTRTAGWKQVQDT